MKRDLTDILKVMIIPREDGKMKVHLFYLMVDKKGYLYAHTATKKFAEQFMRERDMKRFKYKKVNMEEVEYQAFHKKYITEKLVEDVVNDNKETLKIVATIAESEQLSESCDYIVQTIEYIKQRLIDYHLKDDYFDSILSLCDSLIEEDGEEIYVDTIKVFTYLFRNTFMKSDNNHSGLQLIINNNDS